MGKPKRALANIQTAALVSKIFEQREDALEFRDKECSKKGCTPAGMGKAFASTLDCNCAKAEGINWLEIDEVMQYGITPDKKVEEVEVEAEATVIDDNLTNNVLDVADKISDDAELLINGDVSDIKEFEVITEGHKAPSESLDEAIKKVSDEIKEDVENRIKELDQAAHESGESAE